MAKQDAPDHDSKQDQLSAFHRSNDGGGLTTNQGIGIADNQNTLKSGIRGPQLLEDFVLREKITHFDHERIPERVVHARGAAAHGYFQVYEPLGDTLSSASFLQDPSKKTPVFVRFSTVAGFRGSADTARDVRGFAVKFYTEDGNWDLVGNNIPVFFIQDAIKFPDLIHSVKPEPHNEIPQAQSAHSTFWDFMSLMPESMHMAMWIMSDRAIPRSYRMMEGFGIHTFRMIDDSGKSRFVKFHWKPKLGTHALVWDEAMKLGGQDPDFHRRDLWEAIDNGDYPEWEFGVQVVEEDQADQFDFDLLDATKIIPEELVPVRKIGKLVLDRNPDNYFSETEQVAFCPANIVPGIDFSEDPLLQGRLFSYLDTQLIRLGGPNFNEIPINRPVCPVHNLQRDGYGRQAIDRGRTAYEPNSLAGNCPVQGGAPRSFQSVATRVDGEKLRARSPSFADHFTQATLFYQSQSAVEQQHIMEALSFELGKCDVPHVRSRVVALLAHIDENLAAGVAANLGIEPDPDLSYLDDYTGTQPNERRGAAKPGKSPALSMVTGNPETIATRKLAILAMDGFDAAGVSAVKKAVSDGGGQCMLIAGSLGTITAEDGSEMKPDLSFMTSRSTLFDAVYVAGGKASAKAIGQDADAVHFFKEAFRHGKALAASGAAVALLQRERLPKVDYADSEQIVADAGVVTVAGESVDWKAFTQQFVGSIAQHRHWERSGRAMVDA